MVSGRLNKCADFKKQISVRTKELRPVWKPKMGTTVVSRRLPKAGKQKGRKRSMDLKGQSQPDLVIGSGRAVALISKVSGYIHTATVLP